MISSVNDQIEAGVKAHLAGNLLEAESAYKIALNLDNNNATVHNNIGFIYGQQKRWDDALNHLKIFLHEVGHEL